MTEKDFVVVEIDEKMYRRAHDRAFKIGELKNSITRGAGNLAACLGEDAVKYYLKGRYTQGKDKYNHDLVVKKKTVEVKTKRRTVQPKIEYDVSIAKTSRHQKPDIYVFTSVTYKNEKPVEVVILGYMEYEEYFETARLIKKGTVDKSNYFVCKTDMYNIVHSQLKPIKDLL